MDKASSVRSQAKMSEVASTTTSFFKRLNAINNSTLNVKEQPPVVEDFLLPNSLSKSINFERGDLEQTTSEFRKTGAIGSLDRYRTNNKTPIQMIMPSTDRKIQGVDQNSSITRLLNTYQNRVKEQVKLKLAYEWKGIYRALHLQDGLNIGRVDVKLFERVIHEYKVFLSNEELNFLHKRYCNSSSEIDYVALSQDLGLQSNSLNQVSNSTHHRILS